MSNPSSSPVGATGNTASEGDAAPVGVRSGATDNAASGREAAVGVRTASRSKDRRKAAPLAKIGMILFAIGLIAVFADMAMFAAGSRDLPLWVNLTAMLAPVGLGLGLIGVVVENRASSPALAARKAAAAK